MDNQLTFDDVFEQNKRRIHYQIHKMHIQDPHQEFFQEGLIALWNAHESYQPDKGPMATYFNYIIRNRLIDRMRRETRWEDVTRKAIHEQTTQYTDGNYHRSAEGSHAIAAYYSLPLDDTSHWEVLRSQLTDKQWTWVECFIIHDMSCKQIAEQEHTTVEAVKNWGRQVKKKLNDPHSCEVLLHGDTEL
ncbi:hypothetical protein GCM10007063_12210 [Lentibacillus kapialis]|uniref:RNA polymerase sigma-70 region 2 domain-containing protein n=1 Tax=Lentibacillus kapialis TaxID=340214 RepID=A0A917PTF4_9BACI|nr:sigma-70 family RNA polymerase sigma factor [Lentibacillus kapialis]GGJ91086.1 hypothetical protein GCM10007063_12210 [Lentibacillus kapialis]